MNKMLWLAVPAVLLASHALAQTPGTQAPQEPAKPAQPAAAPAKPAPASPAPVGAKPAPAAQAPAAAPAKPAPAAQAPAAAPAKPPAAAQNPAAAPAKPAGSAPAAAPGSAAAAAPAGAAPAGAAPPAAATKPGPVDWAFDAAHSRIGFVVRHLGLSKVPGHFKKVTATIKADPKTAKITELEATAEAASIDTGIEKRDADLKSPTFLDVAKYPTIKLKLKKLNWTGNKFTAKADLTLRDVTKEVTFKGELIGVGTANFGQGPTRRAGYEATAKINRKDFGLTYSAVTEGLAIVSDEVELQLQAEISYSPPAG